MNLVKHILLAFTEFSGGVCVAGAVFAFISIINVIPRLAQKTNTVGFIRLYEDVIMVGGVFGALTMSFKIFLALPAVFAAVFGLATGVFYGCVASSLTETLRVLPIMTRRFNIAGALRWLVLSLALGKCVGSVLYYTIPGFFEV